MSLKNKKIVLCRRREQTREMVLLLHRKGAWPFVFPTFRLDPIELSNKERKLLQSMNQFDWLVLGSKNGVKFFATFVQMLDIAKDEISELQVGLVGKKTKDEWIHLFGNTQVVIQSNNLQDLLKAIAENDKKNKIRVLNVTSRQSLENIHPDVPDNIVLTRLPVYQSLPDYDHESGELNFVKNGDYDAIYFGAPSAFDYFLEVVGSDPLQKNVAIIVSGKTTAAHIQNAGYQVAMIPPKPDAKHTIRALEEYFLNVETTVNFKNN